jgi:predicted aspartyl protease
MVYPRQVRGLNGGAVGGAVELPGLSVGARYLKNYGALVAAIDLPKIDGLSPDGLLGADILSDFDLDLDLSRARVWLACAAGEPAWSQDHTAIAANRSIHDRLFFRAELDGKSIAAVIDTGAQHSLIDRQKALSIGVNPTALDGRAGKPVRGITDAAIEARSYRFRRLAIGREILLDPTLLVAPLGLEDADLILGTDFLKAHRVWISYKSHKIFIAGNDASAP